MPRAHRLPFPRRSAGGSGDRSRRLGASEAVLLSEIDLLSGLLQGEATPFVREKTLLLIALYQRLDGQSDAALVSGNLPRAELEVGLQELRERKTPRS